MHPAVVKHVLLPLHELALRRGTLGYLRELEQSQCGGMKNPPRARLG